MRYVQSGLPARQAEEILSTPSTRPGSPEKESFEMFIIPVPATIAIAVAVELIRKR